MEICVTADARLRSRPADPRFARNQARQGLREPSQTAPWEIKKEIWIAFSNRRIYFTMEKNIIHDQLNKSEELNRFIFDGADKLERDFFNFKLALVTFIGIIFTIVFSKASDFDWIFSTLLLAVTICSFLLLWDSFRLSFKDVSSAFRRSCEIILIHQISDHLKVLPKETQDKYEKELKEKYQKIISNKILPALQVYKSIEEIFKENIAQSTWQFNFYLWLILLLLIPFLFIFKIFSFI